MSNQIILAIYILVEIGLITVLVFLCKGLRSQIKRQREIYLPSGMTIEKKLDKTIYTFKYKPFYEERRKTGEGNG
ncbi:hypothetical protein ES706_04805 [subsurface metagenome]